jgi:hypothetical protein
VEKNGQVTVNGKESFKTINVESVMFESSQFTNVLAAGSDETYYGYRGSQGEIGKGGGIHIVYQKKYGDYEVRLDSSYSNLPTLTVRDKSIGYQHNGVMDNLSRANNVKSVVFLDQAFEVAISQGMPTLVPTTKYVSIIDPSLTSPTTTPTTTTPTIVPEAFQTTNTITVPTGKLAVSSTAANDLITGSTAINAVDTVAYKGSIKDYKVAMGSNGNYTVVDAISTRDGSDVVVNVERLKFSPDPATGANRIALDLDPAQASAKAALLIGAILPGKLALDPSKYQLIGTVIDLFDQGYSLKDLSGALLRLPIWDILTGKPNPTNTDIATYLVNNVYGVTSQSSNLGADLARSLAISAMNAETPATQGTYLATLATSTASQSHIDLVGIQATGLVYLG